MQVLYIVGVNRKTRGSDKGVLKPTDIVNVVTVNATPDKDGTPLLSYQAMQTDLTSLVNNMQQAIKSGQRVEAGNFEVTGAGVKGKGASLDRLAKGNPLVIVAEVKIKGSDTLLGYIVANSSGKTSRVKKADLIGFCVKEAKEGRVPIQNAQFVNEDVAEPFIRTYKGVKFLAEYLQIGKVKNTTKAPYKTSQAAPAPENQFTPEQIKELQAAEQAGVDKTIIMNPKLSADKMHIIWTAEKNGVPARAVADPNYSKEAMMYVIVEMTHKHPYEFLLNSGYNTEQMMQLTLGYMTGVDISKYADPKLSAMEMSERRKRMELNVWSDEFVSR